MPQYDFRCQQCHTEATLFYKSYRAYDEATPQCPQCQSTEMTRLIRKVNIQAPSRDYTAMNANEMLSVLESGDNQQVGRMFEQVSGTSPAMGARYQEATQQLLTDKGADAAEKTVPKPRNEQS